MIQNFKIQEITLVNIFHVVILKVDGQITRFRHEKTIIDHSSNF